MKKYTLAFAILILCTAVLVSCGSRDKNGGEDGSTQEILSTNEEGFAEVYEPVTSEVMLTLKDGSPAGISYAFVTDADGKTITALFTETLPPTTVKPTATTVKAVNPVTNAASKTNAPAQNITQAQKTNAPAKPISTAAEVKPGETYKDSAGEHRATTAPTTAPASTAKGETTVPPTTVPPVGAVIYQADFDSGKFIKGFESFEPVNYQTVTDTMARWQTSNKHLAVNNAEVITLETGEKALKIDYEALFYDIIGTATDSQKELIIKGIVNTYIANFDVDKVLITVNGAELVSGTYKMDDYYGWTE